MVVAQVRRTIEERHLIPRDSRVLVACSGGPDSAALLHCLAQLASELNFSIVAASVDHGVRADSAADVAIARLQAEQCGVPFVEVGLSLAPGPNLQERARSARYKALRRLAAAQGAQRIAVGHTMDDQAETVVSRLLRGASLRGASGIAPRRADGVVRPLIDCRRDPVHQLARERFERIAVDPSNRDERFERVRVRFELLPAMEAENLAAVEHLAALADDARAASALVRKRAKALLLDSTRPGVALSLPALRTAPSSVRREALRVWLRQATGVTASRAHLLQLDRALVGRGEVWLPNGWVVRPMADGTLRARRGPVKT